MHDPFADILECLAVQLRRGVVEGISLEISRGVGRISLQIDTHANPKKEPGGTTNPPG